MKKMLAMMLGVMMLCSALILPVSAAENTAAEDSNSFLYCDTWLPFDSGEAEYAVVEEDVVLFDTFTCVQNGTTAKPTPWQAAYNSDNQALAISTNGSDGYQTRLKLAFDVDLTEDRVIDYKIKAGYNQYYLICDASGNNGVDGAANMSGSAVHLKQKAARYTLVVDAGTKTITYYMDGVYKYHEVYEGDSVTLYHSFQSDQSGTTTVRTNYLYYFASYKNATVPAFQVLKATTTGITVQFNTPVDPTTLTNMTVGESAVTEKTDVSESYNEPNVYTLTVAELADNATYTVSATGVTGLSADGTAAGAALTMATVPVTLGTPVLGFAKRVPDKDGNTLWNGNEFLTSNASNCSVSYDSATNTYEVKQGDTISGEKLTRGSIRMYTPFISLDVTKFSVEFIAEPARSNNTLQFKWGRNWSTSGDYVTVSLLSGSKKIGNAGTLCHMVIDFDFTDAENGTAKVYQNGELLNTVSGLVNDGVRRLWIFPDVICGADETVPATFYMRNFSMYQPTTTAFSGELYDVADGKTMRFSKGLNMSTTTATVVSKADAQKSYTTGVIRLSETINNINLYQVDNTVLPQGEYTVTVNPVAFDGSTMSALTYDITVSGEALTVNSLTLSKNAETGKMVADVNVTNNRNGSLPFLMILAKYDNRGALCDADVHKLSAPSGTNTLTKTMKAEEGYTYKAFAWKDLSGMCPLVDAE